MTIITGKQAELKGDPVHFFIDWPGRTSITVAAFVLIHYWLAANSALGVERVYDIVTDDSSIALSGTVTSSFGTAPIQQQGPGSVTTSYSGTVRTDRGADTIQFLAGSAMDANLSGTWQPLSNGDAGSAPADYGARVSFLAGIATVNFAGRDFLGDLMSSILPISEEGDFDLANATVNFIDGNIAYRGSITTLAGTRSIAGQSGALSGTGSLTTQVESGGVLETLTIPVDSAVTIVVDATMSVHLTLTGQLIATAMLPAILAGDYNEDGTVDAADYVVWRRGDGLPGGYNTWRSNFGATGGGSGAALAVPEPGSLMLFLSVATILAALRNGTPANSRC